jgi:signal transduction histidine kinase
VLVWQKAMGVAPAVILVGALSIQAAIRIWACRVFHRTEITAANWRLWAHRDVAVGVLGGVIWGAAMPWLFAPGRLDLQAMMIAIIIGGAQNYAGMNGAYRPSLYTAFLMYPPAIVWLLWQGDALHIAWAVILLIWLPDVVRRGARIHASLTEALVLRFENAAMAERMQALAADLEAQKQRAEQSNLAKSRFLAAASHDLRQPVHALGMFMGALRGHRLPARSRTLIDHIDASVGALDGLFTSLLDISRLDAGVVEADPQVVALQPLIARVCRDLAPEAAEKGLTLTDVPTSLAAVSDPVHLERILRNLIGNALRYAEQGGVAVGVRRVGGGQVRLEVWDTGPGVPAAEREAIFEEFYQLGNAGRDRAGGLGLGLAIVRRLAAILGHGLSVDSRPGKGSVFRLTLARAEAPAAAPQAADPAPLARPGLILVIDDEAAIRAGMSALLTGWGHRVLAAEGGEAALALLAAEDRPPDLIISDYRLRGEDGLAVIRRLQRQLGVRPPAILLTGDTAPERLREAEASGYPLLHKPLAHGRLRAAVTNLLRRPALPAA